VLITHREDKVPDEIAAQYLALRHVYVAQDVEEDVEIETDLAIQTRKRRGAPESCLAAVVAVELVGVIVQHIVHHNVGAGWRQGACHEVLDAAAIVAAETLAGVDRRGLDAEVTKADA
jgi:hypothetical protein